MGIRSSIILTPLVKQVNNSLSRMEEGTRTKKTVFVGGISDDVDEGVLLETFSAFGELCIVQALSKVLNHTKQAI